MLKKLTIILFTLTIALSIVGCKNKGKQNEKYIVSFDSQGAETISNQEIEDGKHIVKPADPTKEGYIFEGWYNGENKWNFEENTVTGNLTLIAKWTKEVEYTVSLMVNGGQLNVSFIKFTNYEDVILPTPTREFYVFLGWYQGNDICEKLTQNANLTLTAKWEGESYNIIYHLNDGEFENDEYITSYKYDTIATLPTPVKEGYNFKGWYTNSNTTGTAMYKTTKTTNGNLELYAKWEVKPTEVTYVLNGGNWQYSSREQMVEDFLADAMEWGETTRKPNGMVQGQGDTSVGFANVFGSKFYGFFSDSRYAAKWAWLKEYIINATSNAGSKSSLESGAEAFWRYSVGAFIFQEHRATYPISEDYSQDSAGNGFWETLSKKSQSTFTLNNGPLKTPVRIYYVFEGWYDNEECTGSPVTSVTKTMTLYAKWVEEVPVDSITFVDAPTSMDRFEEVQLKWELQPGNAAIKSVEFTSSDEDIAEVSENGVVKALNNGTVTIMIKSLSPSGVTDSITIKVSSPDHFDASYDSESYLTPGNTISLNAEYVKRDGTSVNLKWRSLNTDIATVSNDGIVTGVKEGTATIRVSVENDESAYFDFVVTVLNKDLSEELDFIVNNHESNIFTRYDLGIGAGVPVYFTDILGSVNRLLYDYEMVWKDDYLAACIKNGQFSTGMNGVEFIVVHYTAGMTRGSNAAATADFFTRNSGASAHFCTGNDGVYQTLNLTDRGWHAGDGASVTFEWINTGIYYKESDPQWPTWGISDDSYFTLNGQKTSVQIPYEETRGYGWVTDDKWLNDQGLAFRIVNGQYQVGTTWWCYSNVWEGRICSRGGNKHGIGIESAVDEGSDLWFTWQITAKLCAQLMVKYNLDITRVQGHHFFAAKDCPQPLLENDLEIWWEFIDLIRAEYDAMTKFKNTSFAFEVLNESKLVNDHGRVPIQPEYSEVVTYKVTLSDGTSVTLASMVPGIYNK